jgi:hypothetical protein
MIAYKTIVDALHTPADRRDVDWLNATLPLSIQLELATIPVYLCGMWSIMDRTHEVRRHLKSIVLEEMLHMGWMCNLLTTLGGTPTFNSAGEAPQYPGPLPGGVRPELRVWLAGFSRAMVRSTYMEIETPEHGPITLFLAKQYPTIGAFYSAIADAVSRLPDSAFTGDRQLEDLMLGLTPITTKTEALDAIRIIREQGEGTTQDPFPSSDPSSRAHYYRFAEMYYGRKLEESPSGWDYTGDPVHLPPAYPMTEVPPRGYAESRDFDRAYTRVLDDLQDAWATGDASRFSAAVLGMKALETPARDLMLLELPSGEGVVGPSFQIVR